MATYNKIPIIMLAGISLLLTACLDLKQPGNKIEYYTLEYAPPSADDRRPLALDMPSTAFPVRQFWNY